MKDGWVGFRLTAKLPLNVTKPNCRRPLIIILHDQLKRKYKGDNEFLVAQTNVKRHENKIGKKINQQTNLKE